jgi:hypothetical protein
LAINPLDGSYDRYTHITSVVLKDKKILLRNSTVVPNFPSEGHKSSAKSTPLKPEEYKEHEEMNM